MHDRAEHLHLRIALYRRCIAEGLHPGLAHEYLDEMLRVQAELAEIEDAPKRP